jgi:hypothetical protein
VYVLDGVLVTRAELRELVAMDNRLDLVPGSAKVVA